MTTSVRQLVHDLSHGNFSWIPTTKQRFTASSSRSRLWCVISNEPIHHTCQWSLNYIPMLKFRINCPLIVTNGKVLRCPSLTGASRRMILCLYILIGWVHCPCHTYSTLPVVVHNLPFCTQSPEYGYSYHFVCGNYLSASRWSLGARLSLSE